MIKAEFFLDQDTSEVRKQNDITYTISSVQLTPANDEQDYSKKLYNSEFDLNTEASKFYTIEGGDISPYPPITFSEWVYEIPKVNNPIEYIIDVPDDKKLTIEVIRYVDQWVDTNEDGVPDKLIKVPTKEIRTLYRFPINIQILGTELPNDYKVELVDKSGSPRNAQDVQDELSKPGYVVQNASNIGIQAVIYQLGQLEDGTKVLSNDDQGIFYRSLEPYFKAETLSPPSPEEVEVTEEISTKEISVIVDYDDEGNPIYESLETGSTSVTTASSSVITSNVVLMRKMSSSNPNLGNEYSIWNTESIVTDLDNQLKDQRSKSSFIKVAPGMLKLIVATQCNYIEELNEILSSQVQNITTGADLRLKFNLANLKSVQLMKELSLLKVNDELSYLMLIPRALMAFTEYFNALQKLAGFNEKFYYKEGASNINAIFDDAPDKCFFQSLNKQGLITKDSSGNWKFNEEVLTDQDALYFLSPACTSLPTKVYLGETYSPGYDYYVKRVINGQVKFEKQNITDDGVGFDPNKKYVVGKRGEYAAKKNLLDSLLDESMKLCEDNTNLYEEYINFGENWDNWKPVLSNENPYSITEHKFYSEGIKNHRPYQYTRMSCKDASHLINSNWFAHQWNSASIGDKYKSVACELMSTSSDIFKQIPSQVKQSVQSVVEPMSAIVITPVGPGGVATNIPQILGTVGKITNAVSSANANLYHLLAVCGELGTDKIPAFAAVSAGLALLSGLISMVQSILEKLPSI